eukprot:3934940-Rhodomonas_salina.1
MSSTDVGVSCYAPAMPSPISLDSGDTPQREHSTRYHPPPPSSLSLTSSPLSPPSPSLSLPLPPSPSLAPPPITGARVRSNEVNLCVDACGAPLADACGIPAASCCLDASRPSRPAFLKSSVEGFEAWCRVSRLAFSFASPGSADAPPHRLHVRRCWRATQCAVLTLGLLLRMCYGISGTDVGYAATRTRCGRPWLDACGFPIVDACGKPAQVGPRLYGCICALRNQIDKAPCAPKAYCTRVGAVYSLLPAVRYALWRHNVLDNVLTSADAPPRAR